MKPLHPPKHPSTPGIRACCCHGTTLKPEKISSKRAVKITPVFKAVLLLICLEVFKVEALYLNLVVLLYDEKMSDNRQTSEIDTEISFGKRARRQSQKPRKKTGAAKEDQC